MTDWLGRRLFPLLACGVLLAVGMASSLWWGPDLAHTSAWQVPTDLWGTLEAARRLLHLQVGGLYTAPTGLVSLPGAAVVLVPVVALVEVAGFGLGFPGSQNPHPAAWTIAGPAEVLLSTSVLFAADALAERAGVSRPKRFLLAAAQGVALWSVAERWGHPEDAVAVALLLYGALALHGGRPERSAWLVGSAIAVQPLVLLALPVVVVSLPVRRAAGYLVRAAVVPVALLGAALAANPSATVQAVTNQPNWPSVDHPTPWIPLAPHMSHGAVAAGPTRGVALLVACGLAVLAERRWRRTTPWTAGAGAPRTWAPRTWAPRIWAPRTLDLSVHGPPGEARPSLEDLLWWMALCLALRCAFESVMVAYYIWPVLAIALVSAARRWSSLVATAVLSTAVTFLAQLGWHGRWGWWVMVLAGLLLVLVAARGPLGMLTTRRQRGGRPDLVRTPAT